MLLIPRTLAKPVGPVEIKLAVAKQTHTFALIQIQLVTSSLAHPARGGSLYVCVCVCVCVLQEDDKVRFQPQPQHMKRMMLCAQQLRVVVRKPKNKPLLFHGPVAGVQRSG